MKYPKKSVIQNQIILAIVLKSLKEFHHPNIEAEGEAKLRKSFIGRSYKNIYKFLSSLRLTSLQFIISISFVAITVLAIVFTGFSMYNKFAAVAEENASISTGQILNQVALNLDNYVGSMLEVSNLLDVNMGIYRYTPGKELDDLMKVIVGTRNDIVSLMLFSADGKLIGSMPKGNLKPDADINRQEWFSSIKNKPGIFFSQPHVQNLFSGKHNWVVTLSKSVFYFDNAGKLTQGILVVDMNFNSIDKLCSKVNLGKKGYIYIIDKHGGLVYHPQQQLLYMGLKTENSEKALGYISGNYMENHEGKRRLVTVRTVDYTNWRIIGVYYMDELITTNREILNYAVWISLIGIFFVVAISVSITGKITQPIKELERTMEKVEKGNYEIIAELKGEDEVVHLASTFNKMLAKTKLLMDQIITEQEEKRKSELNALQAQINPHFLYNTLDSIVWMAENGKSQDVIVMVTALAKLFRISISKGKNIISVREEIEHAKNYLIIQNIRYKNKFKYSIEAAPEILELQTMKLIIQPLIENAIYHGVEYMVDKGKIEISAYVRGENLVFQVKDNGLGMSTETLKNLLSKIVEGSEGSGVGVKNVHERIGLYYGKTYGLEIESEREVGTIVRIIQPIVRG